MKSNIFISTIYEFKLGLTKYPERSMQNIVIESYANVYSGGCVVVFFTDDVEPH